MKPPPLPKPLAGCGDPLVGLPRAPWWRRLSHDCEAHTVMVRSRVCGCFARWCVTCHRPNEIRACPDHGRDRWLRTRPFGERL